MFNADTFKTHPTTGIWERGKRQRGRGPLTKDRKIKSSSFSSHSRNCMTVEFTTLQKNIWE